jgi:hypothetical protein
VISARGRVPALSVVEGAMATMRRAPAGEGWGFVDPSTPAAAAHFHSVPQEAHALDGSHRPGPTTKALSRACTGQASIFHSTFASRPQVTIFTRSGRMGCPFVILPQPVCGRAAPGVGRELSPAAGSALACPPYPTRSHLFFAASAGAALPHRTTAMRWRYLASPQYGRSKRLLQDCNASENKARWM